MIYVMITGQLETQPALRNQPITTDERLLSQTAQTLGWRLPKTRIKGLEHIQETRTHLEAGGSVLGYFAPHELTIDPISLTYGILDTELPDIDELNIGWIASARFTENILGLRKMGLASVAARGLVKRHQLEWFPVVQPHYLEKLEELQHESDNKEILEETLNARIAAVAEANRLNNTANSSTRNFLKQGRSLLIVSPEGNRNKSKRGLLRAYSGAAIPLVGAKNTIVQPILLDIKTLFSIGVIDIIREVSVHFGQSTTLEELKKLRKTYEWCDQAQLDPNWDRPGTVSPFSVSDAMMMHFIEQFSDYFSDENHPQRIGVYKYAISK